MEIELQVQMDNMQTTLHERFVVRVWRRRSLELLAELPMTLVVGLVAHYLSGADLTAAILSVREPTRPLARKPLAVAPARRPLPDADLRLARRTQRRSRSRKDTMTRVLLLASSAVILFDACTTGVR